MNRKCSIQLITVNGVSVEAKNCTKCGEVKPLADFHKHKDGVGGRRPTCKVCLLQESKTYRTENRLVILEKMRVYREQYGEQIREYHRTWSAKNKQKISQWGKKYYRFNKDKYLLRHQRRRSIKNRLPCSITDTSIYKIINHFDNKCALTGTNGRLHIDHFIALSTGHGGTFEGNLIPLLDEINLSKCDRNPFLWVETRQDIDMRKFNEVVRYLAKLNNLTAEQYRQFVYWCYDNPRKLQDIETDSRPSIEIWRVEVKAS